MRLRHKKYSFCSITAEITEHRDGTATLRITMPGKTLHNRKHASYRAAYAAWRRWC